MSSSAPPTTVFRTADSAHSTGRDSVRASARSPLVWILLGAAIVRLLLWVAFRDHPLTIWDEKEYDALARTLAASGEFAYQPGGELTSLRPPLYPGLVAAIYWCAGVGNLAAVRLVQAVLSLVTAGFVFWLTRTVLTRRAAYWATAIYCFYPSLLGFNNLLLTETLFTLLLVATCCLVVRSFSGQEIRWLLLAGLTLGLASLTRSIVWLTPPLLALFLLLSLRTNWPRRITATAALLVGFVVVVAPWSIRNTRLQRTFIAIDTMGGRNFMMGNYQYTPLHRAWDAIALEGEQSWIHEVKMAYPPEQRPTQGFVDKLALRCGVEFVKANPILTIHRDLIKFGDFWGLERELIAGAQRGYFGTPSRVALLGLAALVCGAYAVVLFLTVFGVLLAGPADRRVYWLLLAVIAYTCALHTITFGHSRYHLPLIPLMLVFAASAIVQLKSIWQERKCPTFRLAVLMCAAFVGSWFWTFIAVDRNLILATHAVHENKA